MDTEGEFWIPIALRTHTTSQRFIRTELSIYLGKVSVVFENPHQSMLYRFHSIYLWIYLSSRTHAVVYLFAYVFIGLSA